MLLIDAEMPRNCMYCKLRSECIVYEEWLKSDEMKAPKPSDYNECLIIGEVKDASQEGEGRLQVRNQGKNLQEQGES